MNGNLKQQVAFDILNDMANQPDANECAGLMRNMAKLFRYVADDCDEDKRAKYDEVLCQLADIVEIEARAEVAEIFARLERAPDGFVVKLANDEIGVAAPLLEFSKVLSEEDLIDIVQSKSDAHRFVVAGRNPVTDRVGAEIVNLGNSETVQRLVANENAEIGEATGPRLINRAARDKNIADKLANRKDIALKAINARLSAAGKRAVAQLAAANVSVDKRDMAQAEAIAMNRLKNQTGFDAAEWRSAWAQVKSLSDRRQFNLNSIARFCRFGYGHHVASAIAILLRIDPKLLVRWLANQQLETLIVAIRCLNFSPNLFEQVFMALPWREKVSAEQAQRAAQQYDFLSHLKAKEVWAAWRYHAFDKNNCALPLLEPPGPKI